MFKALIILSTLLLVGCDKKHSLLMRGPEISTEEHSYLMIGQSNMYFMSPTVLSDEMARNGVRGNVYQCSLGGSSLAEWARGSTLYENALKIYRDNKAHGGTIGGIFFWQGEGESASGPQHEAETWKTRFTQLVSDLRADLGDPNVRVVFMQVGLLDTYPYAPTVKAQQASVSIPNVFMTTTDGYPVDSDGHHFRDHSDALARRMARVMSNAN